MVEVSVCSFSCGGEVTGHALGSAGSERSQGYQFCFSPSAAHC